MRRTNEIQRRGSVLAGCLVAVVVVIILLVIAGIYVKMHYRGWVSAGVEQVSAAVVKDSGLPQDQKDQILAEVNQVTTDFKAGKISLQQIQKMGEEIAQSPLIPLAAVQAARQKYIEPSDMKPEEKADAVRSLQRFARGVYEKKISKETIDDVIKPIVTLKAGGQWELKDKPTRQELDQFVANAKAKADEAKVPDEAFDLNIAAELKKAINKALGRV